jgi:hypothetical protein
MIMQMCVRFCVYLVEIYVCVFSTRLCDECVYLVEIMCVRLD